MTWLLELSMYFGIYFRFYFQDLFQDWRGGGFKSGLVFEYVIKLRLLVTETSRNRKKKENRGKIDSHQARLLQRKESRWNIYYDISIKIPTQTPLSQ